MRHEDRSYLLYGTVKLIKDFLYIFRDVPVTHLVLTKGEPEVSCKGKLYRGLAWECIDVLKTDSSIAAILCLPPSEARNQEAIELRKKFPGHEFIPCEDFFADYDEPVTVPEGHQLYLWGAGRVAKRILTEGELHLQPLAVLDSFRDGDEFCGLPLKRPDERIDWQRAFVIITVNNSEEIAALLRRYGLQHGRDFVKYEEALYNPSQMLSEVFFSDDGYDFACDTMLNHLEVGTGGSTRVCCTTFMRAEKTNFMAPDFWEHWYGDKDIFHRVLALSTQNRSYVYCDKEMCPLFDGRINLGAKSPEIAKAEYHAIVPYPKVVACGFDHTCNLACETCRKGLQTAKGEEKELIMRIADKFKRELLPHADFLVMAGNGEVLLSSAYRSIWQDKAAAYPRCFRLLSNGLLFNESTWAKFGHGKEHTKIMLTVSIDAATKETYEEIRRLGNFETLKRNMAFAGRLRQQGKLAYFRMNFVVQKKNISEMPMFVAWGKEVGADKVFFTKILNWGTYTIDDFAQNISVMEPDGITPIPALRAILENDELQDPIVDLGTIRYLHQPNPSDYVKNYYMWELEKDVPGLFREIVTMGTAGTDSRN